MEYIAHKREDGTTQPVLEHLRGTAALAEIFADDFDAREQGRLVGIIHDIGKYSREFQHRILENGPRVDHATAGAFECAKSNQGPAAFCVAGHHTGLQDKGTTEDQNEGTLCGRLRQAMKGNIPDYSPWKKELSLPSAAFPPYLNKDALTDVFFTRMLYSCLVDADFLDTERFMDGPSVSRGNDISMEELDRRLDRYTQGFVPPVGELNEKRCRIRESCIRLSGQPQGFFTLTVPTGGGKTLASLSFAIKHALAHGLKRVIYVVPYTSIIDQTAEIFREILGPENVLEHHSGVELPTEERITPAQIRLSLAAENWDMPVIVTTAVQFFESLFAARSSKCRKLHNLARSVLVFDEAQMLPVPYLRPCVYAIAQLVRHYHVTALLCTATQPALESVFEKFLPPSASYTPTELCPAALSADESFRRVTFRQAGLLTWQETAERMGREHQALCIVNSRKNAREVFSLLPEEGRFHLSTLMTPADRKEKLREIRRRLGAGLPCRVVSTSLIEAGVDVDFPAVFREEAGLDSVIQAAGRCNREGKRRPEESVVTVFQPETTPPALFQMNIAAGQVALRHGADYTSPDTMRQYYQELLHLKGEKALDKYNIIHKSSGSDYPFRSIAETFHLIEENTVSVIIPTGEGEALAARLTAGEMNLRLMRGLSQHSVNIYPGHFQALQSAGDILPAGEGLWLLHNLSLYSSDTGLSLTADYGKAEFV